MSIKKTQGPPVAGGSPGVSEATSVRPPWLRSRAFLAEEEEEEEGGCYSSTCVLLSLKPRQGGRQLLLVEPLSYCCWVRALGACGQVLAPSGVPQLLGC